MFNKFSRVRVLSGPVSRRLVVHLLNSYGASKFFHMWQLVNFWLGDGGEFRSMKIDASIHAPKCLICTKAMAHVFPDETRDGMAQVFKCVNCQIVETITEMREAPALKWAS